MITENHLIEYELDLRNPEQHKFHVTIRFPEVAAEPVDLVMPVWTPGCYKIVDYPRHVIGLTATDNLGNQLRIGKLAKNRWRIYGCSDPLTITYDVYARWIADESSYLSAEYAVLNGPSVFIYRDGYRNKPVSLKLSGLPQTWKHCTTSLDRLDNSSQLYYAANYDRLVDCPIMMGNHELRKFTVFGKPHVLAVQGEGNLELDLLAHDLEKVVIRNAELWRCLPYEHYAFLIMLAEATNALEHSDSCYCVMNRWGFKPDSDYRKSLALLAHEHHHVWNVRRMRPAALETVDFERESIIDDLWLSEGFVSYYQDRILYEAGIGTLEHYLQTVSERIHRFRNLPGRFKVSPVQASQDTWIKYYKPDETTNNTSVSYYLSGSLVGLILDLAVRRLTLGQRDLMHLLRELYAATYQKTGGGFTRKQFYKIVETNAGLDAVYLLDKMLTNPGDLPIETALAWAGLQLSEVWTKPDDLSRGYLGLDYSASNGKIVVTQVADASPSELAGLAPQDELIACNGLRLDPDSIARVFGKYVPGTTLRLMVATRGVVKELEVIMDRVPATAYEITKLPTATWEQKTIYNSWLSASWDPLPSFSNSAVDSLSFVY